MSDEKITVEEMLFQNQVNIEANRLMLTAIATHGDALLAVASLITAAARAAGLAGVPLGIQLNLFANQYQSVIDSSNKTPQQTEEKASSEESAAVLEIERKFIH